MTFKFSHPEIEKYISEQTGKERMVKEEGYYEKDPSLRAISDGKKKALNLIVNGEDR